MATDTRWLFSESDLDLKGCNLERNEPVKVLKRILLTALLAVIAVSDSAADAVQAWKCQLNEGKTQDEALAVSKVWADAAKTMAGGSELTVYLGYPVAGAALDQFTFYLVVPDMKSWGTFWDGYEGSTAQEADAQFLAVANCSDSVLENSIQIE